MKSVNYTEVLVRLFVLQSMLWWKRCSPKVVLYVSASHTILVLTVGLCGFRDLHTDSNNIMYLCICICLIFMQLYCFVLYNLFAKWE